jgi:hypothetical protein
MPKIATYLPEVLRAEQQSIKTEDVDDSANRLEEDPLKAQQQEEEQEEPQADSLEKDPLVNPKK